MNHYSPLISAAVTMLLTLILTLSKHGTIEDLPNERSLHDKPIPRTGGIALMAGIMAGWVLLFKFWALWIVLPMLGLFVLSLVDDVRGLTPRVRLVGHFIAALCVVYGVGLDWIWILPVLLYVVWMTNLYNFMDGSDGMAGGMALIGFSIYGIAALMGGNEAFAMLNFSIGAAAMGFLYHNFHPAKVFLGDSGSIPLGFLAAAFGVWGWQQVYWPFWFPVMVFSPFVIDATLTLINRARKKEKLTDAHCSHYYQRLVKMGWGHHKTAMMEYVLMVAVGVSALIGLNLDGAGQGNLLALWGAIFLGLSMWVDKRWHIYQLRPQEELDAA
jgi:UDP-GlcNAc:undecaprenyl-phosphate GlcNAc-1-phosphate transferase